jgi:hypothetical protein
VLDLGPREPMNAERWNEYLEREPEARARVERQTSWRKGKVGAELATTYATLWSRIHVHQIGEREVTISDQTLPVEACLGIAAILHGFVRFEFDPPGLQAMYDKNRSGRGPRQLGGKRSGE